MNMFYVKDYLMPNTTDSSAIECCFSAVNQAKEIGKQRLKTLYKTTLTGKRILKNKPEFFDFLLDLLHISAIIR